MLIFLFYNKLIDLARLNNSRNWLSIRIRKISISNSLEIQRRHTVNCTIEEILKMDVKWTFLHLERCLFLTFVKIPRATTSPPSIAYLSFHFHYCYYTSFKVGMIIFMQMMNTNGVSVYKMGLMFNDFWRWRKGYPSCKKRDLGTMKSYFVKRFRKNRRKGWGSFVRRIRKQWRLGSRLVLKRLDEVQVFGSCFLVYRECIPVWWVIIEADWNLVVDVI